VLGFTCDRLSAQELQPGQWITYTSMRAIKDVAISSDSLGFWAVTSGGAFRSPFDGNVDNIKALRNTDGLFENSLTAVATDQAGNVYLGGFSGSLSIYSESTGRIQKKNDIVVKQDLSRKIINSISVYGSRVYLSTGYGLTVFDRSTGQFAETITKFSNLRDQDTALATLEFGGNTFVALVDSVAVTPSNNLSGAWRTLRGTKGSLTSITAFHGVVYVGSTVGLFAYDPTADTFAVVPGTKQFSIARLAAPGVRDSLFLLMFDGRSLISTQNAVNFISRSVPGSNPGNSDIQFAFAKNGTTVFGGAANGVAVERPGNNLVANVAPEGPVSSSTADLAFSQSDRKLYSVQGGSGLSVYDAAENKWKIYPGGTNTIPGEGYRRIFYDSLRSIAWVSTQGGGLYSFTGLAQGNPAYTQFNTPDLPYTISPTFTIVGKGILDHLGRFVVAVWAKSGQGLARTSDGKTFTPIQVADYASYGDIAEDVEGNLWVGTEFSGVPPDFGVGWVRPDGTTGVIRGITGSALTRPDVNAVIVDQDDALWCGTNGGVRIISNISNVNSATPLPFDGREVTLLQQQVVHAIVVDGVNNKWIGTENGIFVVTPDGSDSIAHFTTDNSPLIDNLVTSIAIDTKKGEAYIGTPNGISRLSTIFKEGKADYSGMHVYPNPLVQTSDALPTMYVTGLVGASTVKIFTVSGRLVASIDGSQLGATVTWNGKEETGRQLSSGVYIVSATSTQTADHGQAKFVLIRKP
jgi:hypothetical protein